MYPLRFEPIFRRYIWGGHRLATELKKNVGDETCAESWEIVDHGQDQSVVKYGQFAGQSLAQLIADHGTDLLGETALNKISDSRLPPHLQGRFPLLLKFLDANSNLSVQVHPDDVIGATLNPPDLGKTEAWFVMHADPGAKIYAGLKTGVNRNQLADAIQNGTTESLLHSFEPATGDCVFIRAGTLHAIGAGLLIAEIQQASNTTFRVFDWNRVDSFGNSRALHVKQSLNAIDFDLGPVEAVAQSDSEFANAKTIVESEKFVMRRWEVDQPVHLGDDKFHIVAMIEGRAVVEGDPSGCELVRGQTTLIPSCCSDARITPLGRAELLEIFLP